MNVMQQFAIRSLKRNRRRTIVTIVGVILSVAMITAVATLTASIVQLMQQDALAGTGDWHAKLPGVAVSDVATVANSPITQMCAWAKDMGNTPVEGEEGRFWYLRNYTPQGFDQMALHVTQGRLPEKTGEVVVSQRAVKSGVPVAVGDTLTLQAGRRLNSLGDVLTTNESLLHNEDGTVAETFEPGPTQMVTVVGIISQPTFERSWSAGYGVVGVLDLSTLSPDDRVDAYLAIKPFDRGLFDKAKELAGKVGLPTDTVVFNNELLRYYGVVKDDNVYEFFITMGTILVLIIVVASVLLIYNSFAISVSERSRQLGILASVGATRAQRAASVYWEALLIAAAGIPLGLAAGIGGIAVTMVFLRPLLLSFINLHDTVTLTLAVPWWSVAGAVFFALVTILLSAWIPARRASRVTPMEAIRQTAEVKLTRRRVRTSKLTRYLFGLEAEIALKNLKRNRRKYRTTIASLAVSLVLFLTVSQYMSTLTTTMSAMNDGYNYTLAVNFPQNVANLNSVEAELSELPGITGTTYTREIYYNAPLPAASVTEPVKGLQEPDEDGNYPLALQLVALDDASFDAYAAQAGVNPADCRDTAHPAGIFLNHAQQYLEDSNGGYKKSAGPIVTMAAGDTLSLINGDGASASVTLAALTDARPMGTFNQIYTQTCVYVTQPVFEALAGKLTAGNLLDTVQTNGYFTVEGDDMAVQQAVESTLLKNGMNNYSLYNIESAARSERNLNLFLGILVYGFLVLIGLICVANILNTVSTNIALRRKEFAMLRSVGMTPGGFNKMVRYESVFYGLKSLLYGLPVSLVLAYLLYRESGTMLDTPFTLPWVNYTVAIAMILAIVFATMLYSTARIKRENIVDALKQENL